MKASLRILFLTCLVATATYAQSASAQHATERYIPIGKSPGLSDKYDWIGEITAVDQGAGTVTIRNPQGERSIRVTDTTQIWVDRSAMRQVNTVGTLSDLIVGRRVEVHYTDYERRDTAAWIKVAGS